MCDAENPQRLLTLVKTDGTQHSVKEHTVSCLLAKDVEGKWLCGCEHVYREKRKQLCMRKKKKKKNDQGKELCICDRGRLIQLKLK